MRDASGVVPSPGEDPVLLRAREHGIDIGLLKSMLQRTPAERLRMLDEEIHFFQEIDRARGRRR
jgi:hypothetical protein